jgi:hypothetical protein
MARREDGMKSKNINITIAVVVLLLVGLAAILWVSHRAGEAGRTMAGQGAVSATNEVAGPLPDMVVERMADPDYRAALRALTDERREAVVAAAAVRASMQKLADEAAAQLRDAELPVDPDAVQTRTRQHAQWLPLEADLKAHQAKLDEIQSRTQALISGRMNEQYAARRRTGGSPRPQGVTVTRAPETLPLATEPIVITNRPGGSMKLPPSLPEPKPVTVTVQPVAKPTP